MRDEGRRELTATTARRIQGSLMKTPPKRGMTPPTVKDTAEAIAACKGSHRCSRMSLQPVGRGFPSTAGMKPVQQGRPLTIVRYEVQSFACSDLPGICLLVEVFQVNAQLITCMGFNCLLLRYRQGLCHLHRVSSSGNAQNPAQIALLQAARNHGMAPILTCHCCRMDEGTSPECLRYQAMKARVKGARDVRCQANLEYMPSWRGHSQGLC